MAYFGDAFKKLSIKEGGYVNDKDDAGGETYRGISRKYNPTWQGWTMIDSYKNIILLVVKNLNLNLIMMFNFKNLFGKNIK